MLFSYTIDRDGYEQAKVTADSRDIASWERAGKGRRILSDLDRPAMTDHLGISWFAAKRVGLDIVKGLEQTEYETTCAVDIAGDAEADPTP